MRRRGETFDRYQFATPEIVHLTPLPCWADLSPEAYRQRVAGMVKEIEDEAAAARQRAGKNLLGAKAILAQHPHTRPERCKKSPAPFVHAVSRELKKLLGRLRLVRGGVSQRSREASCRESWGALPRRLLPPGLALRRWMKIARRQ